MSKPIAWSFSRLTKFETCPRQYYELMVAKNYVEPESEHTKYGKDVHKALELRVSKKKRLPMHLTHLESIAAKLAGANGEKLVEQRLAINSNFEPTDFFAPDVKVRSIIDLAIVNPPTAVLVDYKTGKKISDDFTQLRLAAAMFMLHDERVDTCQMMYYWTKHKKPTTQGFSRSEMPAVWAEFLPRAKRLERAHEREEFPATPNGLCKRFCIVRTCPHHGS